MWYNRERCCYKEWAIIESKKVRYSILDELRGLCIFCMIFYHAFYTMSFMFNMKIGKELFMFFKPVEPLFAGIFILISGLCCNLSHSNLKRGLKLLVVALFLSVVTYFLGKDVFISFGILHMLSLCMILCGLVYNLIKKNKPICRNANLCVFLCAYRICAIWNIWH